MTRTRTTRFSLSRLGFGVGACALVLASAPDAQALDTRGSSYRDSRLRDRARDRNRLRPRPHAEATHPLGESGFSGGLEKFRDRLSQLREQNGHQGERGLNGRRPTLPASQTKRNAKPGVTYLKSKGGYLARKLAALAPRRLDTKLGYKPHQRRKAYRPKPTGALASLFNSMIRTHKSKGALSRLGQKRAPLGISLRRLGNSFAATKSKFAAALAASIASTDPAKRVASTYAKETRDSETNRPRLTFAEARQIIKDCAGAICTYFEMPQVSFQN